MENEIQTQPSYWNSVLIGALVVALLTGAFSVILMYYIAGAAPSMTPLIVSGISLPLTCLLGLIGGIISTRHYAKTFDVTFPLGKGALIGLLTGILASVFATIISQIWMLIDPALVESFYNNMIYIMQQVGMPEAQLNDAIDNLEQAKEQQQSFAGIAKGLLMNAAVLGVVNAITGMIGAKVFASEE